MPQKHGAVDLEIIPELQHILAVAREIRGMNGAPGVPEFWQELLFDIEVDLRINRRKHARIEHIDSDRHTGKMLSFREVSDPEPADLPFTPHLQLQVMPVPGAF